eukprot:479943-Rhodomonas_salina.1
MALCRVWRQVYVQTQLALPPSAGAAGGAWACGGPGTPAGRGLAGQQRRGHERVGGRGRRRLSERSHKHHLDFAVDAEPREP